MIVDGLPITNLYLGFLVALGHLVRQLWVQEYYLQNWQKKINPHTETDGKFDGVLEGYIVYCIYIYTFSDWRK